MSEGGEGNGKTEHREKGNRKKSVRRGSVSRYVIFAISVGTLSTLSFHCNLLTGPHNSTGPDTTSSNFAWTVDTIGASGSYIYDVTIVNDSLAYAVGLLMPSDSVGRSNTIYWNNAAVWNGTKWTPMQVPDYYDGKNTFSTMYAVFAFGPDDILFASGGDVEHWNGATFTTDYAVNSLINGQINKIWGSSSHDYYVVGNGGTIVHYLNGNWTKIQTSTALPFQDIWGATDPKTGQEQILAIASDKFGLGGQYLVELNGNTASHLKDTVSAQERLSGIWFEPNQRYFLVGSGIFEKDSLPSSEPWNGPFIPLDWYTFAIRGQGANDVIVAGESASISHFNGKRWIGLNDLVNPVDRLQAVAFKDNLVIAVGNRHESGVNYYGVVYIGRR